MPEHIKIELAWVSMNERHPPAPGRYLTQRIISRAEQKHGLRTINSIILSAYWDSEKFIMPDQPDQWRDIPGDMQ